MRDAAITLDDVTIAYERRPAVHNVSGCFVRGELTAIAGPNGAGKSTLLKAIIGELPLETGHIDSGGLSIRDFGYLPQAAAIDRQFPLTVADTVCLGAWREVGAFRQISAATAARARDALSDVGLTGFERRHIGSLSAGQFQRVLFARLLLQDAQVILLDEPFTAIDARTTRDLFDVIHRWHAEKRTVIAVLHDFEQIHEHFNHTLLLAHEVVHWGPTAASLSATNQMRARATAENWDEQADICTFNTKVAS